MDEKVDMVFFNNLSKSTDELFWIEFKIEDVTQNIPYVLIPKNEKPPLKIKNISNINSKKDNEVSRKKIEDDIKGNMFDFIDFPSYLDDMTSTYLEMIRRGIDRTDWTPEQKEIVKDGMTNMRMYYPNLFSRITESIQKDVEERTRLFLGGQETPK